MRWCTKSKHHKFHKFHKLILCSIEIAFEFQFWKDAAALGGKSQISIADASPKPTQYNRGALFLDPKPVITLCSAASYARTDSHLISRTSLFSLSLWSLFQRSADSRKSSHVCVVQGRLLLPGAHTSVHNRALNSNSPFNTAWRAGNSRPRLNSSLVCSRGRSSTAQKLIIPPWAAHNLTQEANDYFDIFTHIIYSKMLKENRSGTFETFSRFKA